MLWLRVEYICGYSTILLLAQSGIFQPSYGKFTALTRVWDCYEV